MRKKDNNVLELISSVVCDDIRREDNGKMILIGVYGREVTVGALPALLIMSVFTIVQSKIAGDIPFTIRVIGDGDHQLIPNIPLVAKISGSLTANIVIKGLPINLLSEGKITFQWKMEEGTDWGTIFELRVKKGEVPELATPLTFPPDAPSA
jgi:hypothetical protein